MNRNTFFLEAVAPYRLDLTVWTLRRRPHNLVDRWDGETYRRTLAVSGEPVEVAVIQTGSPKAPRLQELWSPWNSCVRTLEVFCVFPRRHGAKASRPLA